uniref:Uncharacterized protein n=1 Tax=Paramormyrops kingsleyae TaxID=1676925 RepID=A0A3B3SXJ8_9TELE
MIPLGSSGPSDIWVLGSGLEVGSRLDPGSNIAVGSGLEAGSRLVPDSTLEAGTGMETGADTRHIHHPISILKNQSI